MIVAIHQPNFFPWAGFFHKILISDKFIILDDVQFQKKGGTYGNRVQMLINNESKWVTMPVERSYHGYRNIDEITINDRTNWRKKILTSISLNYAKAPFYKEIFSEIEACINKKSSLLSEYNINAIQMICGLLKIDWDKVSLSSRLSGEGTATDRLISLTKKVGGNSYLCGGGAANYQEDTKFASASIKLVYQNFSMPEYGQVNSKDFIYGLSIIDMLFNCGVDKSITLLKNV